MGNAEMASKNAMNFNSVSRRDDLISLTYLLIYLKKGSLDFINASSASHQSQFHQIRYKKNKMSADDLCASKSTKMFQELVKLIHALKFEERPQYKLYK